MPKKLIIIGIVLILISIGLSGCLETPETDTDGDGYNDKNLLTQALSWLFNIRSYSFSRGLVFPLKPKSSGECESCGLVFANSEIDVNLVVDNIYIIRKLVNPLNPLFKDHWI
jgi:hypothetical protein